MPVSNLRRILDQLTGWHPYPLAMLVYVDVRHMRSVNQLAQLGDGDTVIAEVARAMREWAGEYGLASRVWSNEFIGAKIVDHGQTAIEEATALRERLADIRYGSVIGENRIAVSVGLVVTHDNEHWAEHIGNAADACAAAKRRGLNQIVSYSRQHSATSLAHVNAANVLAFRRLRAEGRLLLDPQPVMDIRGEPARLAKAEFLIRVDHGDTHLSLPPGTIETLEYFSLATELDAFSAEWVMGWIAQHPEAVERLDGITLNLSARSIADGRFMSRLYQDARAMRLPRGKLGFEITETAAIQHLELAAELIEDFRGIGCSFSLDDFGSGLCSFGYLHSLPVDEVKIDGRFIRDIVQNPVSQEIVRAIQQVAHATGKRTVAEFVDDPHKLAVLKRLGVDYAQGWLFYPAIRTEQLLDLLAGSPAAHEATAAAL